MRNKYTKSDIKLKYNSMHIIAYRVRHNKLMAPLEPTPWEGQ
jgi:hypothetical protein